MNVRTDEDNRMLENLSTTVIQVGLTRNHTLTRDIIETVTGVSSGAIGVGGKLTAGSVIIAGGKSKGQETAFTFFSIGTMIFNVIDFLMTPLGYLYKAYRKEVIPFNTDNNIKWAIAGLALMLAVISAIVHEAAGVISFVTSGISFLVSIYSVWKFVHDYRLNQQALDAENTGIQNLNSEIIQDMREINELQDRLRFLVTGQHADLEAIKPLIIQIAQVYQRRQQHGDELKHLIHAKHHLERTFNLQKTYIDQVVNIAKVFYSCAVIVGTALSIIPATAIIGIAILAATAVLSLLTVIVKQTIQIIYKRHQQKIAETQDHTVEIHLDSTAGMMRSLDVRNTSQHVMEDTNQDISMPLMSDSALYCSSDELHPSGVHNHAEPHADEDHPGCNATLN